MEIGTGSGALTLFLILLLGNEVNLYSLDADNKNQYRAHKTIERYLSTLNNDMESNLKLITSELINFYLETIEDKIDTIVTEVPETWDLFENNIMNKDV